MIVTYSDRFNYLKKVLNNLSKHPKIYNITVVNNGATKNSAVELKKLSETKSEIINVIDLKYNAGSAKGFKVGITEVSKKHIDYIWLLDDDNLPNDNTLDCLLNYLPKAEAKYSNIPFSLLSFRPERHIYKKAIQKKNPYEMLGATNSFLGFNITDKLSTKTHTQQNKEIRIGQVAVAPYGGMFFNKNLINQIGLPNEKLYLYADDHDFSYRITAQGGKIILLLDSALIDLETSFHLKKTKSIFHNRFLSTNSKDVIFYSVRNNILFEKNFIKNKTLYFLNKWTYIVLLFFMLLASPKHFWKFKIIVKAIKASNKKSFNV